VGSVRLAQAAPGATLVCTFWGANLTNYHKLALFIFVALGHPSQRYGWVLQVCSVLPQKTLLRLILNTDKAASCSKWALWKAAGAPGGEGEGLR